MTDQAPTPQSLAAAMDGLDAQVERAQLFTHTALGENAARLAELQAMVHGLTDALLARGQIDAGTLADTVRQARDELQQRGEHQGPGTRLRLDGPDEPQDAMVDCASRMSVCKAVCCRLNFALSVPEIEAGAVRWDLGQPYFIRKRTDGACVHQIADGCGCSVYAQRPGVCRRYSCEHDARIWSDFEGRVLNTAWIDAHLGPAARPRAEVVHMHAPLPRAPEPAP
jgi:Fe-S-cluster containining protein